MSLYPLLAKIVNKASAIGGVRHPTIAAGTGLAAAAGSAGLAAAMGDEPEQLQEPVEPAADEAQTPAPQPETTTQVQRLPNGGARITTSDPKEQEKLSKFGQGQEAEGGAMVFTLSQRELARIKAADEQKNAPKEAPEKVKDPSKPKKKAGEATKSGNLRNKKLIQVDMNSPDREKVMVELQKMGVDPQGLTDDGGFMNYSLSAKQFEALSRTLQGE